MTTITASDRIYLHRNRYRGITQPLVQKRTGISIDLDLAGSPEGSSFLRIRKPFGVRGWEKVNVAVNSTELVVIQSPSARAGVCPRMSPSPSVMVTGKEASKYQLPTAEPETVSGLWTKAFGSGFATAMSFTASAGEAVIPPDG